MGADVRVRFAPSPTGYLHVGGARTALFNWLFARHHGGKFVLRIEDTDVERYDQAYYDAIFRALRWLGLDWDEGPDIGGPHAPYRQSERAGVHTRVAGELERTGAAYRSEGALWLRVDKERSFLVHDVIRGDVTFPPGTLDDFVIVKSDGGALYNFAAAIDDHEMAITHVVRGDEHLANTPKQLLVYEAMGWEPPAFAHIPIILNERRQKLSKRDGATFVNEYELLGYLPEALVNFLGLLGWSPGDDREIMTPEEMVRDFRLEAVVKHPAIFDHAKLAWMNKEYLRRLQPRHLAERGRELLLRRDARFDRTDPEHVEQVAALLRERVRTVGELIDQGAYFFTSGPVEPAPEALAKHCRDPQVPARLHQLRHALARTPQFTAEAIETAIRALAEEHGEKAATYIHPLRVALTGQTVSPGIFEVCRILGRQVVLKRIESLAARLEQADRPGKAADGGERPIQRPIEARGR